MMQEITREQLNGAIETINEEDDRLAVRDNYSGRAMSGAKCVGVVGSHAVDAVRFMLAVAEQLSPGDPEDQKVIISEMATAWREDGMGHQVIYYFPGWQLVD